MVSVEIGWTSFISRWFDDVRPCLAGTAVVEHIRWAYHELEGPTPFPENGIWRIDQFVRVPYDEFISAALADLEEKGGCTEAIPVSKAWHGSLIEALFH